MAAETSWYRTGTVSVVSGGKGITGAGSLWASQALPGDLFALTDTNGNITSQFSEVEDVVSDTSITLKTVWPGASLSGQGYVLVRNFTGTLPSDLAAKLSKLLALYQSEAGTGSSTDPGGSTGVAGTLKATSTVVQVSVGASYGEVPLLQTAGGLLVLSLSVTAATLDRYDIELYDGASSETLVYRAQQVSGSYLDSLSFYLPRAQSILTAKVTNLRSDAAPFSATVALTYAEVA